LPVTTTNFLPSLEDILDSHPLTVALNDSFEHVLNLLSQAPGSCALVMEGPRLAGIFTQRDVVKLMASRELLKGEELKIAEVMSSDVVTLNLAMFQDIFTALTLFHAHHIRHLPVIDSQAHLIGIITLDSIRRALQPVNLIKFRQVKEVMSSHVIYTSPTTSVLEVNNLMAKHGVSCVVLAEINQEAMVCPKGIITERDIVRLHSQRRGNSLSEITAGTVMSQPLHFLKPKDTLWEVEQAMSQYGVRRLVVVTEDEELAGIVTQTSLVKILDPVEMFSSMEALQQTVQRLESEKLDLLQNRNRDLKRLVKERTLELEQAIQQTQSELQERQRAEAALRRVSRVRDMLSKATEALLKATEEVTLWKEICRIAVEEGGYRLAWVGLVENVESAKMIPVAYFGTETDADYQTLLEAQTPPNLKAEAEVNHFAPPYNLCSACGSSIELPLLLSGERLPGTLNICAKEPDAFDPEEIKLLEKLAGNLTYGINALRTRHEREEAKEALLQSQEQFRQAQKLEAVGRLAGGVAHDFNNILTSILCSSDLVLQSLPTTSEALLVTEEITEIKKEALQAANLTRQLLAFSRRQVLNFRLLNLNETVQNVEKMLRRLIGEDIELGVKLEPQLGTIKSDAGQLEQVILNLAVNARDAMPSGGKLVIETINFEIKPEQVSQFSPKLKQGSYVILSVRDTGTGMTPETLAHIFEPFFTTKEPGKGTGLGLSTVYEIVEQSGGYIVVESQLELGTNFKIYLPLLTDALPEMLETTKQVTTFVPAGTETILIVEDEERIRYVMSKILTREGYHILKAAGPEEALTLSRDYVEPIHIVITDMLMPGMNGLELTKRMVEMRPTTKFLLMSGYSESTLQTDKAWQEDVIHFLPKPFTMESLKSKVRQVLDQSQPLLALTIS